jgi:DNA-binding MarR family transcriptional regulator
MLEQHGLPITWFDVLSRLTDAPNQRMRMHELEEASLFTRSGITALADRLEKAGLVERQRSSEDRRGVYLVLTQAGSEKFEKAWVDHQGNIQEHFGRHIDGKDAKAITAATKKVRFPDGE